VDPRVVEAASRVKDAEIVSEPVPEGDRFAVLWRRQSMKAVNRTLEQEAPSIRQVIAHNKAEAQVKELLARLRKEQLEQHNPDYVDLIDISSTGDLQPVKRPGTLPSARRPNVTSPTPRPSDMR
jgi:peptidyl-prolyl cis-trans isomerase C